MFDHWLHVSHTPGSLAQSALFATFAPGPFFPSRRLRFSVAPWVPRFSVVRSLPALPGNRLEYFHPPKLRLKTRRVGGRRWRHPSPCVMWRPLMSVTYDDTDESVLCNKVVYTRSFIFYTIWTHLAILITFQGILTIRWTVITFERMMWRFEHLILKRLHVMIWDTFISSPNAGTLKCSKRLIFTNFYSHDFPLLQRRYREFSFGLNVKIQLVLLQWIISCWIVFYIGSTMK